MCNDQIWVFKKKKYGHGNTGVYAEKENKAEFGNSSFLQLLHEVKPCASVTDGIWTFGKKKWIKTKLQYY